MKKLKPQINYVSKTVVIGACVASLFLCADAKAVLTSIGPFVGSLSETWESFPNYLSGGFHYESDPTTIMGGAATISNPFMAVYEPSAGATFGLAFSGSAGVSDGTKAMGIDTGPSTATISFSTPVFDFGAYWGAATFDSETTVSLSFSDGSLASFSYSRPGDGVLEWHGWNSSVGITGISYTGDFVVIDGLQANTAVPEPSTYLAGALLALPFGLQGIRRLRARKSVS